MAAPARRQLRQVLGHNARALNYINQQSSSRGTKIAHNKLATKRTLQRAGLPTPRLYSTLSSRQELLKFRWTKLPSSFVLKPRSALGGGGIVVIFGRNKKGNWITANKDEVFIPQLHKHVLNILDGNFSTANLPDIAFFEQRIKNHPDLKPYSFQGIPDIRVVVYNQVPVMAMLRLPTPESHGKANLHAGGIGVGIDLARGTTTTGTYRGRHVETVPGTQQSLSGIKLPHWPAILLTAVKAARAVDLPFAGVDITIDRDDGPMILEVNSHPGLDIQLANMAPLLSRLRRVEDLNIASPAKGVQIGINLFGGDVDQEIEDITGQTVLGITEPVQIVDSQGAPHEIKAKIDTGAWRSALDTGLAKELGLNKTVDFGRVRGALGRQEREIIDLTMHLRDHKIKTKAYTVDRSHMKYPMIIGRRDLKGFLVDPSQS